MFLGNTPDPDSAVARIYALTGPAAPMAAALEKAVESGEPTTVIRICRQELAKLDRDDKAQAILPRSARNRGNRSKLRDRRLDAHPTGRGLGRMDGKVWALVGQRPGPACRHMGSQEPFAALLLCRAKINPNFEIAGHAEVLGSRRWAGYGAALSYQSMTSFWECLFYPPRTGDSEPGLMSPGNRAYVRCVTHNNRHERAATVSLSDDFRVRVFDGCVATTVGDETKTENSPLLVELDHDPPSGDMPFGICVNHGIPASRSGVVADPQLEFVKGETGDGTSTENRTIVRFSGLKVRKMTSRPVQGKRPLVQAN